MKQQRKKYRVAIYFHAHYYLGTIDMGDQGFPPEHIDTYETWAVSKKQAENNVRFRFDEDGGFKCFPHDQFDFFAEEMEKDA